MNFNAKRFNKKMARLFLRIAWSCVIIFFITIILLFSNIINKDVFTQNPVLMMILFIGPFMFATIFIIIAIVFGQNRTSYMLRIKKYRQIKTVRDIMDYIYVRDFEAARDAYNNRLKDGLIKTFLFGYFLGTSLSSDDPKRVEISEKTLKKLYDDFNPAKIDFNK